MTDDSQAAERRTRETFAILWQRERRTRAGRERSHLDRVLDVARFDLPAGSRFLDAGCGDASDLAEAAMRWPSAHCTGIDFNTAIALAASRVSASRNASVVRASVLEPPFRPRSFTVVYSYGVLHHTRDPRQAFGTLAELVDDSGWIVVYVYSDLREEPLLRIALRAVNAIRRVTKRLPPRLVYSLARLAAPLAFALLGLPALILRCSSRTAPIADRLPLNWATTPFRATGDLYDRFSAPIETRHGRHELEQWAKDAGLAHVVVTTLPSARGWVMIAGGRAVSAP